MSTWTRLQKSAVIVTSLYMAMFVFMLIARPGSEQFYAAFFNIYQIFPPMVSGIVGLIYFHKGRHSNRVRRAGWLLIAGACLSFALGQCTWTYFESIKGISVPFPSLADAGYIGAYPALLVGVLLLFGSVPGAGRARLLLDSAIVSGSLGILSWYFIVQRIWHESDLPLIGKCISVAYPLGDIAALFGAVVLISNAWTNHTLRHSLYFLAAGICGFTFFDTSFTWMSLNGTYQTGSWSDWTVSFGWICIGFAFFTQMWWTGKKRVEPTQSFVLSSTTIQNMRQIVLPYASVITACSIVCVFDYAQDAAVQASTLIGGMFLMSLVIIRQIFTLMENRSLTFELQAFNENLEDIVAERTEELEIQNRKILALVDERNRFFRNVSHELRTPLTSVIGFAELLADDELEPLTSGQQAQLHRINDSAHKLLNMVNDLLQISRAEAGKVELSLNPIKLNEFLEEVVSSVRPIALEKSLDIKLDVGDNLPDVITDEQRLGQILVNLLSNALKYTRQGGICIRATRDDKTIAISVEDTGIGIPEDKIADVFREFYRVNDGPSRERGTGLGLTIAEKMAALLGGHISVRSKEGEGSTFTLTLPVNFRRRRVSPR